MAALLGATLLGRHPGTAAKSRGKGNAADNVRSKGQVDAAASARTKAKAKLTLGASCYPSTRCTPGKGKNTSRCDFTASTLFVNKDVRGANLSNASFILADLAGADLRGTNLSGACFVETNLLGAKVGRSVNLGRAIFCNTVMPDGSINNSGCDDGTACCPTTCQGENCPPEGCNELLEFCGSFAGPCCTGLESKKRPSWAQRMREFLSYDGGVRGPFPPSRCGM